MFNFLDYLLWKNDTNAREKESFRFTFRDSVEHWYPRNPEESSWEEVSGNSADNLIDRFGNLCLVRQDTNVRLSNSLPSAKKTNMKDTIARESLKLHRMRDATTTDEDWVTSGCAAHEKEMLNLLYAAMKQAGLEASQ